MQLWAVTMVKDEIDIIRHTLEHLAAQDVDGIVVADNMSTDGTCEQLHELKLPCEFHVTHDLEPAYYQSDKMTALAQHAFRAGADWVIPFDADELWYPTRGTLKGALEDTKGDCALATLYNYFPTSNDNETEPNPCRRITHRDINAAPLHKVAVRRRDDVVIAQGNHDANGNAPFERTLSDLEIAHFPWRGPERFERKVRNGCTAYKSTNLPADAGAHWRSYGQLLEEQGPDALRQVYNTWFLDPPTPLEEHPAPLRTLK